MANIKNLQMWQSICDDVRINTSKSMFGLCTKVAYGPTNSPISALALEYSPDDGKRIKQILDLPKAEMAAAVGDFHPATVDYGNYMAELCTSRDRRFLAVQLYHFVKLNYEPATDVLVLEGDVAEAVSKLFL